MIDVAVYNREGKEVESLRVDTTVLGGSVRYPLLKQAIVMYQANKRVGTAATKDRSMVVGSGTKLYRQKGSGNARVGNRRTNVRVGGGVAFAKVRRDFSKQMPKKQRRLATDSAVLAKLLSKNVVVVDGLELEGPKTKEFAGVLSNLKIERSCLVATNGLDANVYKSARNIPRVDVMPLAELNAGAICNHQKLLLTKEAMVSFLTREEAAEKTESSVIE